MKIHHDVRPNEYHADELIDNTVLIVPLSFITRPILSTQSGNSLWLFSPNRPTIALCLFLTCHLKGRCHANFIIFASRFAKRKSEDFVYLPQTLRIWFCVHLCLISCFHKLQVPNRTYPYYRRWKSRLPDTTGQLWPLWLVNKQTIIRWLNTFLDKWCVQT